ncbi:Gfo/Idh/MocA family protein [Brachybacterium hainanense]|uniref:Gfo/Idh/MocA family protein n=1 Tax=Brachybacterium hainanense TaxID=1541174 RepID=A0ABV6R8K3_9MICO
MRPPYSPVVDSAPASVALIGSGWRAEFILGVIAALPERFELAGMVVRTPQKAARMSAEFGAPAFATLEELLAHRRPDFLVLSVPRTAAPDLIVRAVRAGLPVLTETPPADTDADLTALFRAVGADAPVQVAEQYHRHPLIAAQIAIARSGKVGTVREARVSISHEYHAISIMRRVLGIGFEDATITAHRLDAPLIGGPGRSGDPQEERMLSAELTLGIVDFGDRFGVYDWAPA